MTRKASTSATTAGVRRTSEASAWATKQGNTDRPIPARTAFMTDGTLSQVSTTSSERMKTNQGKFETFPRAVVPILESGAMIRKGKTGAAHEDGMTSEIAGQLRSFGSKIVTDPVALAWLYEGGPLPA
jgi:hypothetical protein